ncbi:hypothetical protein A2960_00035 [Candidatus Gottesmanbacteria bacterium RIFCSPLOWO2_01_FULL_39_12b]|uniref:RRM domain-containing protein n=1 Tax=Candidatus Gottesmanbacteria bacterium RIFCSPLOWO2_01_FULL_39_12b TaxID=1798388 RepID=A0A1F6AS42_9BACT|nr:MAG: hypothetical protein A2960_00035 [Candidatus Gottesmanbacteria bacterium RIFCSPLOWO2_01_FULL_39_12b]
MGKNLFVGSLPYTVTDETLSQLFTQYGQVQSANVIKDKYTGSSRGFGFVEMANEEEAQKAIEKLNGYSLEGRTIIVKEALPKPTYTNGRGGGPGGSRGNFRGGPGGFRGNRDRNFRR